MGIITPNNTTSDGFTVSPFCSTSLTQLLQQWRIFWSEALSRLVPLAERDTSESWEECHWQVLVWSSRAVCQRIPYRAAPTVETPASTQVFAVTDKAGLALHLIIQSLWDKLTIELLMKHYVIKVYILQISKDRSYWVLSVTKHCLGTTQGIWTGCFSYLWVSPFLQLELLSSKKKKQCAWDNNVHYSTDQTHCPYKLISCKIYPHLLSGCF